MKQALWLEEKDTVAVATEEVLSGEEVSCRLPDGRAETVIARTAVPAYHKIAVRPASVGQAVIKYGQPIGTASAAICPGDHVHTHNLRSAPAEAEPGGVRRDAEFIVRRAIEASLPDAAVRRALSELPPAKGKTVVVALGKAAWQMARTTAELLGGRIDGGVVVTKYGHSKGDIPGLRIFEAGHPVPDDHSFSATQQAIDAVRGLSADDQVILLISGGGSALFEQPLCSPAALTEVTRQLLACGADIVEMNTIRKRLSRVKGGRFGELCAPASVFAVILSDIIGDPVDMIASGPAVPDASTCGDALAVVEKYRLSFPDEVMDLLRRETPKELRNVKTVVTGSVRQLCAAAAEACAVLGYRPVLLTDCLQCEAREAGRFLAAVARTHQGDGESLAFLAGGETVVHLTGKGKGGRNQELALAAAPGLSGLRETAVFSVGSDGTDGPTDAAGGYADEETLSALEARQISLDAVLQENDAYHALRSCGGLIVTGPTGTNVNDVSCVLIRR